MESKLFWTGVLAVVVGLAAAVVNCQGETADHSSFEARDPIWDGGNSGIKQDFCHDGRDNDGDGFADAAGVPPGCTPGVGCLFEPDPECQVAGSTGEAECSDNLDNDSDGFFDKTDIGCYLCGYYQAQDNCDHESLYEYFIPECCDGEDNDCDGDYDFADSNCGDSLFWEGELKTKQCNDGKDNETVPDGLIDYPADPDCLSICDDTEG